MNAPTLAAQHEADAARGDATPASRSVTTQAIADATRRIAPLWPLRHFVAVNPFLGLADHDFDSAARVMARVAGAKMTAARTFFADAIRSGRIQRTDLEAALAEQAPVDGAPTTAEALHAFAFSQDEPEIQLVPTVDALAQAVTGKDWGRFLTNAISRWASTHFDEGQAFWRSPWRDLSPYAAWHAEASLDATPEVAGIRGFRASVRALPETAEESIHAALQRLAVPAKGLANYLHRLLVTISGWAAYARYRVWESELRGESNETLVELLAIRLAWEVALLDAFAAQGLEDAWHARRDELAWSGFGVAAEAALAGDLLLQAAFEKALQRELVTRISLAESREPASRPAVQATFCIDVRSEIFRRALESVAPDIETLGFAGFFGFPIEYVPLGSERGGAQCPVLLTPQFVVTEGVRGASQEEERAATERRGLRRSVANAWRSFKFGAVSCFGFVGPVGLAYLPKIITDSLGRTRPVHTPGDYGLDDDVRARLAPRLEPGMISGRATGMTLEQRLSVAEGVLGAMSLTCGFARLVLLIGHGSTTVNNPHATGLDCGACGGHTGEANARVAAAVLQDPEVRAGLEARGIRVPDDTVFLACQHDTTTDEVTIFDQALIPASHLADVARLRQRLLEAGRLARAERAPRLNIEPGKAIDAAVIARSRDWSQVRPEWGLAGCSAFIAAPRRRTRGVDLGGRAFLHSYEWQQDQGFGVLELIMTAPMVVASWINLQYYGSTVDNHAFGSGNKVLHNVVGTLGVLEGNGGDLRVGLPWQSVHDGEKLVHEPVRLSVFIEAPVEAMNRVLEKHASVRELLDNGWLDLFAIDETGAVSRKYAGNFDWVELPVGAPAPASWEPPGATAAARPRAASPPMAVPVES
jgi:uncharacterized protein YbcC (UPF0753/DUF2309 family)